MPPPAWGAAAPLQRVAWQAPAAPASWTPGAPGPPVSDPAAEGRLFGGRAIALVATCIGLGVVMQTVAYVMSSDTHHNTDTQIRWDIVLTVIQYAIVAGIVLSQITPKIKLRWGPGAPLTRVLVGAAVGIGGGVAILLLLHAETGTLTSDSRVVLLMSGGEMTRIIAAVALTCLAAPLVEEVLFRGLLLESLRHYQVGMALVVSAMFFAIWHLNRQALIYYTAMGGVFGALYLKRGLIASMTAHFCFNGVLTIAAIYIVLGPAHTYTVDGLSVTVESGWTDQSDEVTAAFGAEAPDLSLQGPDASLIAVSASGPVGSNGFDPDGLAQRLEAGSFPFTGVEYIPSSVRLVDLPTVGRSVEVSFTLQAENGEDAFIFANGEAYVIRFVNGGSEKAASDFNGLLNTLQPEPAAVAPAP
jgi:membrane protease YdiL (CAAX protease family)